MKDHGFLQDIVFAVFAKDGVTRIEDVKPLNRHHSEKLLPETLEVGSIAETARRDRYQFTRVSQEPERKRKECGIEIRLFNPYTMQELALM